MIKYKYLPFSFGKPKHKGKEVGATAMSLLRTRNTMPVILIVVSSVLPARLVTGLIICVGSVVVQGVGKVVMT